MAANFSSLPIISLSLSQLSRFGEIWMRPKRRRRRMRTPRTAATATEAVAAPATNEAATAAATALRLLKVVGSKAESRKQQRRGQQPVESSQSQRGAVAVVCFSFSLACSFSSASHCCLWMRAAGWLAVVCSQPRLRLHSQCRLPTRNRLRLCSRLNCELESRVPFARHRLPLGRLNFLACVSRAAAFARRQQVSGSGSSASQAANVCSQAARYSEPSRAEPGSWRHRQVGRVCVG